MPRARVFASLADVCGSREIVFDAATLGAFLDAAAAAYGDAFTEQLPRCRLIVNDEVVDHADAADRAISGDDEIAILPPTSGG